MTLTLVKNNKTAGEVARLKRVEKEKKKELIYSIVSAMMDMTAAELVYIEDEVAKIACKRSLILINNNTLPSGGGNR